MFRALFFLICCGLSSSTWAITLTDDTGHQVNLARPAERIVSLAPHITELLFSLEVGDRVVATVAFSDYPEAAKKIPVIGGAEDVSIESILAVKPDLVVAWQGGSSTELLSGLERLGIPVYRSSSQGMTSISQSLKDLSVLTKRQSTAYPLIQKFDQERLNIIARFKHKPRVRVFYQLWHDPLMTANSHQLISEMISVCGGENLFAERIETVPQTSVESVVMLNPDLIIAPLQGTPTNWRTRWLVWKEVSAVKNSLLVTVDADLTSRPTLRSLQGLLDVCQLIDQARDFQ